MAALSNPRWERFCQELLVDDNQSQAYIRAGYSRLGAARGARRLIVRPEVAARVAGLRTARNDRIAETAGVTQGWIVARLLDLHERTLDAESWPQVRLTLGMLGKHISMWPTRPAAAGKAVTLGELIAKAYKADEPDPE